MGLDRDLQSIQEVRDLIKNAKAAQKEYQNWTQEQVDSLVKTIAEECEKHLEPLAKMALLRKYYEIFGEKELALKAQINEHKRAIAALEAKLKDNQ